MSCSVHIAWDEALCAYDFGPGHPMAPIRLDLTVRLARELGLLDGGGVKVVAPEVATDELLTLVHEPAYLAAVRRCSGAVPWVEPSYGLGTEDDPAFTGMHEATARIVGGTVAVAEAVWRGEAAHGVNFSGGLHHAMPGWASGFCVYNDLAVAIRRLLDLGASRVAYVDLDVHHGDGVQAIFWDDPRVLTISLHETPRTLFPGTGYPEETGGAAAEGSAVNVALPPGTNDAGWLRAFDAVVPPLLREFAPDVIVSQHGCDGHAEDPLAHLALTVDGQRAAQVAMHELAHELCDGRWVATGGGGYALVDVVPRSWSHLIGIAGGRPVDPDTAVPEGWRSYVQRVLGRIGPYRMTDGGLGQMPSWAAGFDPADDVDRAVIATQRAVFPAHGLAPVW